MKDLIVKICIVIINIMSVGLIVFQTNPINTLAEKVLRVFLVLVYLITLVIITQFEKDENENNRNKHDDM